MAKAPAVKPGLAAAADFNLTLLYNASSLHDDLAWAAGWLYKATKQVGGAAAGRRGGGAKDCRPWGRER